MFSFAMITMACFHDFLQNTILLRCLLTGTNFSLIIEIKLKRYIYNYRAISDVNEAYSYVSFWHSVLVASISRSDFPSLIIADSSTSCLLSEDTV